MPPPIPPDVLAEVRDALRNVATKTDLENLGLRVEAKVAAETAAHKIEDATHFSQLRTEVAELKRWRGAAESKAEASGQFERVEVQTGARHRSATTIATIALLVSALGTGVSACGAIRSWTQPAQGTRP